MDALQLRDAAEGDVEAALERAHLQMEDLFNELED